MPALAIDDTNKLALADQVSCLIVPALPGRWRRADAAQRYGTTRSVATTHQPCLREQVIRQLLTGHGQPGWRWHCVRWWTRPLWRI
ncbi:MAG: hypothetical protein ACRDQH_09260 [Pseudonocardiaceae bacterium]